MASVKFYYGFCSFNALNKVWNSQVFRILFIPQWWDLSSIFQSMLERIIFQKFRVIGWQCFTKWKGLIVCVGGAV
jgi:hypothetical protein